MLEGYCTTLKKVFPQFYMLHPRGPGIPMSAEAGELVQFHINSDVPYKVQLMRLRSAADVFAPDKSLRATLITPNGQLDYTGSPVSLPAHPQTRPADSWSNGCAWEVHFSLDFSPEWQSGFYSAYCLGDDGSEFYISFIVKPSYSTFILDQGRRSRFAMLASTNTWNAYNNDGGRSYYDGFGTVKLSFERPFRILWPCAPRPDDPDFVHIDFNSRHTLRANLWLHTWLEDNGYQVDLFTDLDFHFGLFDPADYAGLILGTHPEYWTWEMRDRLDQFLQAGGRLIYLGGNGLYERVLVDLSDISKLGFGATGSTDADRWFFRKQGRSERAVLGVAYSGDTYGKFVTGYRARVPDLQNKHRFFNGIDVSDGTSFGDSGLTGTGGSAANGCACGWEMDTTNLEDSISFAGPTPEGVVVLAESEPPYCQMTAWDTPWGGLVYSVGSLCYTGSLGQDPVLAPILRNVLDECLGPSPLPWDPKILKWLEEALRVPPRKPEPPGPVETPENEIMLGLLITRLASHSRSEATVKELKRVGFTILAEAAQRALRSMP